MNQQSTEPTGFNNVPKFATDYLFGHPFITNPKKVYLFRDENELLIAERFPYHNNPPFVQLATIPLSVILSIEAEDRSGIEKKFSLGKFMLMGGYAFAFPKKEKVERAFLLIRSRFQLGESTVVFENKGDDALKTILQARSVFLHWIESAKG